MNKKSNHVALFIILGLVIILAVLFFLLQPKAPASVNNTSHSMAGVIYKGQASIPALTEKESNFIMTHSVPSKEEMKRSVKGP